MRESLRARLVLWYAVVLTLVVVLYGGAVVYQSWRSAVASIDAELTAYGREIAAALRPADDGRFDLELPSEAAAYFFQREGGRPYYVIWNAAGEIVDRSDPDLVNVEGAPPRGAERTGLLAGFGRSRQVRLDAAAGASILVGRDIEEVRAEQWRLAITVLLAGIATLVLAIGGGWFVAGRALAPVKRISAAARAMSGGDLDARIAVDRTETELEQVASTLNEAFDRLREAVEQERRFTADASHELRTPISVLRAETEWALGRERTAREYQDALAVCRRAALRMQDTVERLLALVRAEVAVDGAEPSSMTVSALLQGVVDWLAPVAHDRAVAVSVTAEPLTIRGDPEQLREALNNVVANAILYNRPGGSVTIRAIAQGSTARIEVVDSGIGIPADAVPRVFERFYRVDKARSREMGGSGLGLSIARAVLEAHGGAISCTSEPGVGSVFVITLPLAAPPAPSTPPQEARTRARDSRSA